MSSFTKRVFIEKRISKSTTLGWVSIISLTATALVGTSEQGYALDPTCTVTVFDDSVDGEGTAINGTLRHCLEQIDTNGNIDFDTPTAQTISISSRLFLDKSGVTIQGPDFSGEDPQVPLIALQPASAGERILAIQAAAGTSTTIKNLKFLNGSPTSGDGGAIDATDENVSDLEIINSHFEGNTADGSGGAIKGGDMTITNSLFKNNQSLEGEGGAVSGEVVSVVESIFDSNEADGYEREGGALHVVELSVTSNSIFKNNFADAQGGAIHVTGSEEVEITDSVFSDNSADYDGGAVFVRSELTVTSSEFKRNIANTDDDEYTGGAIAISTGDGSTLNIDRSTFEDNQAYEGGAISTDGPVFIQNSLFNSNIATDNGGALIVDDNAQIVNTSFVSNQSDNHGGAIKAGQSLSLNRTYFSANVAGADGGTGRGGSLRAASATVSNSTFSANTATGNGGAVYISEKDSTIELSTFVDNVADSGLSIYVDDVDHSDGGVNNNPEITVFANLFLSSSSTPQLLAEAGKGIQFLDKGANVSSSAETVLDAESSNVSVDYSALGVGTPEAATLSLRPFVTFENIAAVDVEVTADLANSYTTDSSRSLPVDDQQGTTRTYSFFPGAEFIEFVALPSSDVGSPSVPYSGPLVTSIDSNSGASNVSGNESITVYGERLSTVTKVFVGGMEGEVTSTSSERFEMVVPEGLTPGNYDLEIQSSIGNLTYLGAFVITKSVSTSCANESMSYWTTRISDTQAKVYIKCPELDAKIRILHQTGGSGEYDVPFVKTITSLDESSLLVNEFGTYIVRTIELEEINRIRIRIDDQEVWKVRYNR